MIIYNSTLSILINRLGLGDNLTKESVLPVCDKPYHMNKKFFVELCLTALVSASGAVPFSVEAAEGDIRQGPAPGEAPLLWNDGHVRAGTRTPRPG